MSMEAVSWAFNLDLPSAGTKLTLLVLANSVDEDGFTTQSQAGLSKKTGMTTRSIRTHLATLEKLDFLVKTPQTKEDGSTLPDLFKLNIGAAMANSTSGTYPAEFSRGGGNIYTPVSVFDTPMRQESTRGEESYLLPEYISQEAWDGFVEMREAIRKPLTSLATKRILKSLERLRAKGEDVNDVLDQSTIHNWMGVFPIKRTNLYRGYHFD